MSDNELLIRKDIAAGLRWRLPNISDMDQPPYLSKYKYSDEGYGLVGKLEYGPESEHHDLEELIIRVPHEAYYATTVGVPRDNSDFEWEERTEEGVTFVVWRKVVPVQVTRYIWKTKE